MAVGVPIVGGRPACTLARHPETLRSNFGQRLEIDDYRMTVLLQGFDGSRVPDSYDRNELPWELALMRNVPEDGTPAESPASPPEAEDKAQDSR